MKKVVKRRRRVLSGGGLGGFDSSKCRLVHSWACRACLVLPGRSFTFSSTGNLYCTSTDLRLSAAASTSTGLVYCRMSRSADLMLRGTSILRIRERHLGPVYLPS